PVAEHPLPRPKHLDRMIELAEKLAAGIAFLRVDFYELDGRIYFGELTFYPGGGLEEFAPEAWDRRLGEMIDLSPVGR
ncbi:MAG: glycosyl transferase, partial [Alistipes sp.]|nr:glycosyl transferase [Alistipes sp.]